MATSESTNTTSLGQHQLEDEGIKQLELPLPKQHLFYGNDLYLYQGFWCPPKFYESIVALQNQFQANDSDIIMASLPKTGTTWLKSLIFTLVHHKNYPPNNISQHPLSTKNPHELVHHFEISAYEKVNGKYSLGSTDSDIIPHQISPSVATIMERSKYEPNFESLTSSSPRLFATHIPFTSFPESIKSSSNCRIVYICRNPIDTFVSLWHFVQQIDTYKDYVSTMDMEEIVAKFCKGVLPFGPYDEHLLGYWKESLRDPQRVLVLEYEGLKKDPKTHLRKLAEFVGCPFSVEEENGNVIEEIIELCSLKSLKEMEANKSGKYYWYDKSSFFRKGEVGDWNNDLTPSMVMQFDQLLERLNKAGFYFQYYQRN